MLLRRLLLLLLQLLRLRLTSRQPSDQWFDQSPVISGQMFGQWSKTARGRAGPPPVGAQGRALGARYCFDQWSNGGILVKCLTTSQMFENWSNV